MDGALCRIRPAPEKDMNSTAEIMRVSPYQGYSYAYPHKTAYRHFVEPTPLAAAWADQPLTALFLYIHVPFCEMRCGFCNLFTQARPSSQIVDDYVEALARQS